MSDFSPEVRNSAIWSGDSRKVASGKANEVILTKQGKLAIEDLSGVEAVQMGHVMEPVILSLAQDRLGVPVEKFSFAKQHDEHDWLKSHFDGIATINGRNVLIEAKNYNAKIRSNFDADTGLMPAADRAQCVHEAAVMGVDTVFLAVLFGGQEFVMIRLNVSEREKEELIQLMAQVWGHVRAGTHMPPETVEQCKLLYPSSIPSAITASMALEQAAHNLKIIKEEIKRLEDDEEAYMAMLQSAMRDADTLQTVDGQVLATWKSAKPSKRFSADLFKSAHPSLYEQFVIEQPGSRRFLLK